MTVFLLATGDAVAVAHSRRGRWDVSLRLPGIASQCLAADRLRPECVYCGTYGRGVWRSGDAGDSWQPAGEGIPYGEVMSVAVSVAERVGPSGVVWAGTEPSALFRSEDEGNTWQERPALRTIPSAPTWSFPPRPWTHHVRWITPDPVVPERLFVGIELGGVMRSVDAGLTWEDRKHGSEPDAHTLGAHPLAPGRVYEAAGAGYSESHDGGATWHHRNEGLDHWYLWGLAVDPTDPETIVVSAAAGPRQAHDRSHAESTVYRATAGRAWEVVRGLPGPRGTRACELAANHAEPGVFYAATREGEVYRSPDAGLTWDRLDVVWPPEYQARDVRAFIVADA
jgi:hypothetical protein